MSSKKPDSPGGGGPLNEEEEETGTIPQPTVEIEAPGTETQALTSEGTEILDAKEEVLVLLPEGAEGDIPVVETEEVSEETSDHTEILKHQSLPLEDVPLKRVNPLSGPEEAPADNLEDLASQAEDDFLSAPEEPAAEIEHRKPSRARRRDLEGAPSKSVPDFFPSGRDDVRSGPRWKVPLTLAAVLAIAATAFFTYPRWKHLVEGELTALTGGPVVKTPADPGVDPITKSGPQAGFGKPAAGAKSGVPEEVARASKEAFREKFLLSVELGYVGEVSNE